MSVEDFQLGALDALLEAARLASGDANEPYYASDYALEGAGSEHDDYGLRVGRKPPPARRPAPTPAGKKKKQKGHRCPNKLLAGGPCICCGARLSPQWRRPLDDESVLCNACGIYYTRHHVLPERRPQAAAPLKEEPDTAEEDDGEYEQQQAAAEQEAAEWQQQVVAAMGGRSKLAPGDAMRLMHMHPQPATRSCDSTHLAIPIPNCSPASTADAAAQPQQQPQQLLQQGLASQLHPSAQPTPHVRHVATSVAASVKAAAAAAAVAAATQALAAAGNARQGADVGPRQQGSNAGSTPGSPSPSESSSFTPHSGTKKRGLGAVVDGTSPTVANKVSRTQAPSDQPGPLTGVPGSARMLLQSRLQPVQPPAGMPHGVQVKTEAAAAMELPSPNSAEQAALLLQLASSSRGGPQRARQQPQARQPAAAQAGGGRAVSQAQAMMQAVTYPAGAAGQLVALPHQQPQHALVHAGAARPPRAPTHAGQQQQQQQLQQQQRQAVQVVAPQGQQFAVPRGQQPVVIGLPSFLLNAAGQMVQLPAGAAMRPQAPGAGRPAGAPGAPVLVTHGSSGGGAAGAATGTQTGHSERPAQGTPTLPVAAQQFMAMGPQGPVMLQRTQGGGLQQVPMLLVAGTPMQAQGRAVSGGGATAGGSAGAAAGMPMQQARGVQLMGHALPPGTVAMRAGPQGMMQAVQMAPMQYMWPGRWVAAAPQQQQQVQQQGKAQGGP